MEHFAPAPDDRSRRMARVGSGIPLGTSERGSFGEHAEGRIRAADTNLSSGSSRGDHRIPKSDGGTPARVCRNGSSSTNQESRRRIVPRRRQPVGGNSDGDVTLVEFFDYNCSYCRQMAPMMTQAESADSRLRVVYKEFPILGPNSKFAAKAALAAHKQGKYLAFHKALFQVRGTVDPSKVTEVAATVRLDVDRLKADMEDPAIAALIEKNLALAQALPGPSRRGRPESTTSVHPGSKGQPVNEPSGLGGPSAAGRSGGPAVAPIRRRRT